MGYVNVQFIPSPCHSCVHSTCWRENMIYKKSDRENERGKCETKRRGTQCVAFGCKKRRKPLTAVRSDSSGESDDESTTKQKFPRTFHG